MNIFVRLQKSVATSFFAVNRLRKITWASQVGSRAKIRTTYTSHPRSARQEVDGERTHADAHMWMERLRARPLTKPSYQRTTIVTARDDQGKAEKLQLSRAPWVAKAYRYLCIYHIKVIDCLIFVQSNLSFQFKM